MSVVGVRHVENAAAGDGILGVSPGDVVTPLARERAQDLGVQLRRDGDVPDIGQGVAADGGATLPPTPSNALLRRGAPTPGALRPGRAGSRVVVVGAGHVGQIAALRLCDADAFEEVVLVDVVDGLAAGIALDLTHTAALGHFTTHVRGATTMKDAGPADYVIITAGRARQPGMSRNDLITTNAAIVGAVSREVAQFAPEAVIVVVTNPLDEMTHHAWRESGFPKERVMGMAGLLDTARFQALVGLAGDVPADAVSAYALGSHGEEMVVPVSQVTVDGDRSLPLPLSEVDAIIARTRASGAEVVGLLKTGSAFMAPGTSAAHMVLTMKRHTGEILPAAVQANGEYGIEGVYVGLPARLGPKGVESIVELPLDDSEVAGLRQAAERIRDRVKSLDRAT